MVDGIRGWKPDTTGGKRTRRVGGEGKKRCQISLRVTSISDMSKHEHPVPRRSFWEFVTLWRESRLTGQLQARQ
jgi:hypothetical protein